MTYSHSTNSLLTAAAELSRGDSLFGLARARLAFQSLADTDDEREIAEAVGLILLGVNASENQEHDAKGRVA